MEYFWTGVGLSYFDRFIFFTNRSQSPAFSNDSIGRGALLPLTSTWIASYFEKLIPWGTPINNVSASSLSSGGIYGGGLGLPKILEINEY